MNTYKKFRCYFILTISLFILPLFLFGQITPKIYYVSNNGSDGNSGSIQNPFKTIQKAADNVSAGDSVIVMQGTYGSTSIIGKQGNSMNWIVFKNYPGEIVIIDSYSNNYKNSKRCIELKTDCRYIEINGFKLTDSNPIYDHSTDFDKYSQGLSREGIRCSGQESSHIRIINNEIYHIGFHGIGFYENQEFFEIKNNYIHDVGLSKRGHGIYIGGDNHIISNNLFTNCYGHGIHLSSSGVSCDNNIVENNICWNNGHSDYGKGYTVHNKTWPNGFSCGDGIIVSIGIGNIIRNNLCYGNYLWGIRIQSNYSKCYNNTVYNNGDDGIYIFENKNITIRNCISYNNHGSEYYIGAGNSFDHNLFGIDPQFVSPINNDFRLKDVSPAIDSGVIISDFNYDLDGNKRPFPANGAWDIGAYEFAGPPSLRVRVNITANPTSGNAPLIVQFSSISSGGRQPYSYHWNFGDGNSSDQIKTTYTYNSYGSFFVTLTVTDSENNQANATQTIIVHAGSENQPSIKSIKFKEADKTEKLSAITTKKWYDLYIYLDAPTGWNDIEDVDVWLSHETFVGATIENRGGIFSSSENYIMSYSIADNTIWAKESEQTTDWTNITGQLGLYIVDTNNEYDQNSEEHWAKARIKLVGSAQTGNWVVNACVMDKLKNKSKLFTENIVVENNDRTLPTAQISINTTQPVNKDTILVTLIISKNIINAPTSLMLSENDSTNTMIDLNGPVPGNIFTGTLILDDSIADGLNIFSLQSNALLDENGNYGNEIISGAFIEINRYPPTKPISLKVSVVK